MPVRKPPFFIVGTARGGTTMFQLMLNQHPALSIPGETWFLSDLMDRFPLNAGLDEGEVAGALSIIQNHWRWKEWGIDDADLEAALLALDKPTLAEVIDALFRLPTAAAGKDRWGDKTPGYRAELARLHQVFPEAKFLHLIRDGRDVVTSLRRTGWQGEISWTIAKYWSEAVSSTREAGRALPEGSYLEIQYERLVLETEPTLREICAFLDEPFDPGMLSFHESAQEHLPERTWHHLSKTFRPPQATDVQRWRREMSRFHLVVIEAFAGSTLEAAGYERSVSIPLGWVRALCRAFDGTAKLTLPLRKRLKLHFPKARKRL